MHRHRLLGAHSAGQGVQTQASISIAGGRKGRHGGRWPAGGGRAGQACVCRAKKHALGAAGLGWGRRADT